jgi:hypothetical protein
LYKKIIFPSTSGFRAIVSVRGVPGFDVTTKDVKANEIWGQNVLKMKGNTVRRNDKHVTQSIVKVSKELIKLQQDVELAIDVNNSSPSLLIALRYPSCMVSVMTTVILYYHPR